MTTHDWHDRQFMTEAASARQNRVHPYAHVLLVVIGCFVVVALFWSAHAGVGGV
ncbi:MAG: hypothetical protein HQL95_14845, partial [Magnetococcales bacterium]|nr:hypothetical protein [Magnetococcales bacterium]